MSHRLLRCIYIFLCSVILFSPIAEARWATLADAALNALEFNHEITINADGSSKELLEEKVKVLKEGGRQFASHYTIPYNAGITKVQIIEAKTISPDGSEHKVEEGMIEDKPIASTALGFDEHRQIKISFPKLEIGAEIYIKFSKVMFAPIVENFYSTLLSYGQHLPLQKASLKISSKLPLYLKINDPEGTLNVTTDGKDGFKEKDIHTLTLSLNKPVFRNRVSVNSKINHDLEVMDNREFIWISLSSLNHWEDLAKKLAPHYEEIINQPLPGFMKAIVAKASKISGEAEQINFITSTLNEEVHYMGDWRSVSGKFFPRSLEKISSSRAGDCKDFSVSTAAMLKSLGYTVQPALVARGENVMSLEGTLPTTAAFNHVFLKVVGKQGKVYWIDPTNFISMASYMFADIADKRILILDSKAPKYEKTPAVDPSTSRIDLIQEIKVGKDGLLHYSGTLTLKGPSATIMAGAALATSEQIIKDSIFYQLSDTNLEEANKKSLALPDLTSRVVQDLEFKFAYKQGDKVLKTNLGRGVELYTAALDPILSSAYEEVSSLIIGPPQTRSYRYIVKDIKVKQIEAFNYERTSPWVDVKRTCHHSGHDTEIETTVVIKQHFISRSERGSPEYYTLKKDLSKNFKGNILVID